MKINLVTSLHLSHESVSPGSRPGAPLVMQIFVPVGLLSLKAAADQAGVGADIRVTEINSLISRGVVRNDDAFYESIASVVLEAGDDFIGLMSDADSLHHSLLIAEAVKRRSPNVFVCLGGPAASPIGRSVLETFPQVDFVVRGEGEITFIELIKNLQRGRNLAGVLGLAWRDGGKICENPEREVIRNLDELPVPFFDGYQMDPEAALYLDVGRGCPFNCSFCGTAPFWKRLYRMKSIGRIIDEMRLVRDRYGRSRVNFSHDIFTCDREWTHSFCDDLIAADLGITWTCSTRTDVIDESLLRKMAAAGCVEIYYGIESGSQGAQTTIKKNLDLDQARETVRITAASGIHPITGFIVGYPTETLETFQDTLEKFFDFLSVGGFRAHLFALCPYHDSAVYRDHREQALAPSECYDLPLEAGAAARGQSMRERHPAIFASTHRYVCEHIPAKLVAASEELSPKLALLKSLWPRLLPHYESTLDWYERWTDWIESRNARLRPGTRFAHQGDLGELLLFVNEELARLGLTGSDMGDLARYEQLKLDASALRAAARARQGARDEIDSKTVVVRRCDYVAQPFHYSIRAMLAGEPHAGASSMQARWVVCFRSEQGDLRTLELPCEGMRALELADGMRNVGDLFAATRADGSSKSENADAFIDSGVNLVQQLIRHGLLEEVASQ